MPTVFHIGPFTVEAPPQHGPPPSANMSLTAARARESAHCSPIVGDSLFACPLSKAGPKNSNARLSEKQSRARALSLPDESVLCPGHGPITTVAIDEARIPFSPNS